MFMFRAQDYGLLLVMSTLFLVFGPPVSLVYLRPLDLSPLTQYYVLVAFWSLVSSLVLGAPSYPVSFNSRIVVSALIGLMVSLVLHFLFLEFLLHSIPWFNVGYFIPLGSTLDLLILLVSATVMGVCLEISLRGHLFTALKARFGIIVATIVNCLVSAVILAPLGPGVALYNMLLPLISITLLQLTKNMGAPILFHTTYRILIDILASLI